MKITYHRDNTVTIWNVYTQTWERTMRPSDEVLAALDAATRIRVRRHCEDISRKHVEELRANAAASGDIAMVHVCARALNGSGPAWQRCKDVILGIE